jgi:hypothetical protein
MKIEDEFTNLPIHAYTKYRKRRKKYGELGYPKFLTFYWCVKAFRYREELEALKWMTYFNSVGARYKGTFRCPLCFKWHLVSIKERP